jgi:plastocyanin
MVKKLSMAVGFMILAAALVMFTAGCAQRSSSSGGGSSSDDSPGSPGATGSGSFRFEPASVYAYPGQTVQFTLLDGTASYKFGYQDPSDICSYYSVSQIQATFNSNTGVGSYTVGPYGNCTDRLAAQDGAGSICYMTVVVLDDGSGSGTDPGGSDPGGSDPGGSDPGGSDPPSGDDPL